MIRRPPRSTQSRSSAASDVYKRQFIYRKLSSIYLGGTDVNSEGKWIWSDGTSLPSSASSTTDDETSYNSWINKEPNNSGGKEHCLVATSLNSDKVLQKWNDISCTRLHGFVCKMNHFHGHVYYFSGADDADKKNFDGAEAHCKSMGAHLTSVLSQAENDYLYKEARAR